MRWVLPYPDISECIISLNQEGRKIEVIYEDDKRYIFEI